MKDLEALLAWFEMKIFDAADVSTSRQRKGPPGKPGCDQISERLWPSRLDRCCKKRNVFLEMRQSSVELSGEQS